MLASSGESIPPWGVPVIVLWRLPILGQNPGFEERLHQTQDTFVSDPIPYPPHESGVVDLVEARLDVTFEHPVVVPGG